MIEPVHVRKTLEALLDVNTDLQELTKTFASPHVRPDEVSDQIKRLDKRFDHLTDMLVRALASGRGIAVAPGARVDDVLKSLAGSAPPATARRVS